MHAERAGLRAGQWAYDEQFTCRVRHEPPRLSTPATASAASECHEPQLLLPGHWALGLPGYDKPWLEREAGGCIEAQRTPPQAMG